MDRLNSYRIYEKLKSLFGPLHRACLMTSEFELLYVKPESLADIGTLPLASEVSHKYLHLRDGDITITNDPYSGGTVVCSPTLVMGVGTRTTKNKSAPAELLVASRLTFVAKVGPANTIDDEGLRIPPSPYFSNGMPNPTIVDALKSHPLLPADFFPRIEAEIAQLLKLRARLKDELRKENFSRTQWRHYLRDSEQAFHSRLDELPEGVGTSEIDVSGKESIRLKAEIRDGHIFLDFTGTTAGQTLFMTDSATIGAAVGTFLSLLKSDIPINMGVLSRFEIKAPKGSLVNSSFPRPLYLGHTDGLNLLANIISLALYRIDRKLGWAMSGVSHCSLQLIPNDGPPWLFSLPTGLGATSSAPGLDSGFAWRRFSLLAYSIEDLERRYQIEFVHCGIRAHSGGGGRFAGGQGAAESFKILQPVKMSWNYLRPPNRAEGLDGGKSGQDAEIVVQSANGQKTILPSVGEQTVQKGDIITLLSGGGGGFGANSE